MLKNKGKSRKKLLKRLKNSYRLSIINAQTFEEKFALRLSPMNVLILGVLSFVFIGFAFISMVIFTPLKEYIPGYTDNSVRESALYAALKADSLEEELAIKNQYVNNIMRVLKDEIPIDSADFSIPVTENPENVDLGVSDKDLELRKKVEEEDQYAVLFNAENSSVNEFSYFFAPVRGIVTQKFDPATGHLGVDVVAEQNETIKAALGGTVIVSTWTIDGGNEIHIQHENNMLTVYKHNSVLLRKVGDVVKAGDSVAIIGNSGETSSGPHLHFELWKEGSPADPETSIVFN